MQHDKISRKVTAEINLSLRSVELTTRERILRNTMTHFNQQTKGNISYKLLIINDTHSCVYFIINIKNFKIF